jgi:hypothetical protein
MSQALTQPSQSLFLVRICVTAKYDGCVTSLSKMPEACLYVVFMCEDRQVSTPNNLGLTGGSSVEEMSCFYPFRNSHDEWSD